MQISTPRLRLVSASIPLLSAELEDPGRIGSLLGATLPSAWPPELFERDDMERCLGYATSAEPNWGLWYVVTRIESPRVAGVVGFGGAPRDGAVIIGYSIAPEARRQGIATEAVKALVAWAFTDPRVGQVRAETFPELEPSIGVLRKAGFVAADGASTPGAIAFAISRPSSSPS